MAATTRRPTLPGHQADLARFEAMTPDAPRNVRFLLSRGATLLQVQRSKVRIAHAGRTASIDAQGRVQWDV